MPEKEIAKTFNRLSQKAGEFVNKAEKTQYSPHTVELMEMVDQMKPSLSKLISAVEEYIHINIAAKVVEVFQKNKERSTTIDKLASAMEEVSVKSKSAAPNLSKILEETAELHQRMGEARRSFDSEVDKNIVEVLKKFLNEDVAEANKAKKKLEDCRLDLDSSKNKLKNAKDADQKSKLTNEVKKNEGNFKKIEEESTAIFELTCKKFDRLNQQLVELVKAEHNFYENCVKEISSLHSKLGL